MSAGFYVSAQDVGKFQIFPYEMGVFSIRALPRGETSTFLITMLQHFTLFD